MIYGRVRQLQIKISYEQNNQEHATGDGSQFVTTRHTVSCSGRRVGAARPRGSSPPRPISLEQPVVDSHVQVRQSGASAPPLTVSARAGGTPCGRLLGPITQSVVEWRWLFATHANPGDSAEAVNLMSVLHPHFI